MRKVVFLGPRHGTYSEIAYTQMRAKYGGPKLALHADPDYIPASMNQLVLSTARVHGAHGVVAMETLAERRIVEVLDSFIDELEQFPQPYYPLKILGAKRVDISFTLMARPGISVENVVGVIAHEKAIAPCKNRLGQSGWKIKTVRSNGLAAKMVSEESEFANWAALGPETASEQFGLNVLERSCEDGKAVTTFFFFGPSYRPVNTGKVNRLLVVFKVRDVCGALADTLQVFKRNKLNLLHLHSKHIKDGVYHFVIESEFAEEQIEAARWTVNELQLVTEKLLAFGPFVIE